MQSVNSAPFSVVDIENSTDRKVWLRIIYWIVIGLCLNSCMLYVFRDYLSVSIPIEFLYLNVVLLSIQVVGLLILWKGSTRAATHITVYASILAILLLMPRVTGGGLSLELASFLLVIVTIGNTMMSGKWSLFLWLICLACAAAAFFLERQGIWVGQSASTPETQFLVFLACFAFAYFPQRLTMRQARQNAEKARDAVVALGHKNDQLKHNQAELKQSYDELELRIMERTMELTHEVNERTEVGNALKQSEQRFRTLVEATFDGYAIFEDSYVVLANEVWAEYMRLEPGQAMGMTYYDIFEAETAEQVMMRIGLDTKTPFEVKGQLIGGHEVAFEMFANETVYQSRPATIIGFRDVSERIRTELKQREDQVQDSLAVLAGGVAHDFNNLLVAMLAQNSLALASLPEDHKSHQHIKKAVQAAEQAATLTKQLQAYTGRGHLDVRSVQINELIRENRGLYEAALSNNVQLRLQLDNTLPEIRVDTAQMQQIIMNLLLNGAEAIGSEQGEVIVSTSMQHISAEQSEDWQMRMTPIEPGEYVVLEVEDDGSGIDENTITKIFDPFYTTKPDGRGLGLAATIGIIRSHNAGIEVASKVGSGTIFRLLFPIADDSYAARFIAAEPLVAGIVDVCVLLIESNYHQFRSQSQILRDANVRFYSAENLHEGLQCYRQHAEEIGIVIVDLTEPGLKREAILNELYLHNPNIQVILTSDDNSADLIIDDLVSARLVKPISKDRLITTVFELI